MTPTHEPVAVLGIGAMGHGMATSALRAGIPTIVWNRTPEATRDLAELGAESRGRRRGALPSNGSISCLPPIRTTKMRFAPARSPM